MNWYNRNESDILGIKSRMENLGYNFVNDENGDWAVYGPNGKLLVDPEPRLRNAVILCFLRMKQYR